ncbi:thyroid adenoma-associated protein homolog [Aplysia californica]|uniref:Thyroid adenoma-associated protein homolog n=1 Tax=Aplysia californica TaxID=6500 RepID=A0ABM1VPN9_APLCA|nr:thyroid adenoma-associated protein homolog [Aplysia californica]XP_035824381.1 thyroid adenoma-associated protein homolog [Aplysia californica]
MTLFTEFGEILDEVNKYRSEDVLLLIRRLDQLQLRIPPNLSDQEQRELQNLSQRSVEAYLRAVNSAKLTRALDKTFRLFPSNFQSNVNAQINSQFLELLHTHTLVDIVKISALLELNKTVKSTSKELFSTFSSILRDVATQTEHDGASFRSENDVYVIAKLSVQILQLFPASISAILAQEPKGSLGDDAEGKTATITISDWTSIISSLLTLFFKSTHKDVILLLGTAIAMIYKLFPDPQQMHTDFCHLLHVLCQGPEITSVEFHLSSLNIHIQLSLQMDLSVHVIAIVKGLLVSYDSQLLSYGEPSLLLTVFPHISALCCGTSTHHYLSFQLMSLWFQKAVPCAVENIPSSSLDMVNKSFQQLNIKSSKTSTLEQTNTKAHNFQNVSSASIDKSVDHGFSCEESVRQNFFEDATLQDSSVLQESTKEKVNGVFFMSSECPVLHLTLDCVSLNWDSPVEGVSDSVTEIFRSLLSLWQRCQVSRGTQNNMDLSQHLLDHCLCMAWHSRARYKPISLLLPYVDCSQLLQRNPQLKADLLRCMKVNSMAAIATDVYKAFLQQIISQHGNNSAQIWSTAWRSALIDGLTSADSLQRIKTCTYWLPVTLKMIAGSESLLLSELEVKLREHSSGETDQWLLFAWVTVSRVARDLLHHAVNLKDSVYLHRALLSDQEETRAEAVLLLCSTVKRAEPISELEVTLLKEFIPVNLKTDSTPFRQSLTFAIRKMTVRVRDSCLSACKSKKEKGGTQEPFLERGLSWLDWLYSLLVSSLAPGASYQRRQTTLDLLSAVMETLVFQEQVVSKKGKAQESCRLLVDHAQSRGMWNFWGRDNVISLLACLQDGAEEIQNQVFSLLLKYYRAAVSELLCDRSVLQRFLSLAMSLLSRPKAYENHSGLLLMSLILHCHVMESGLRLEHDSSQPLHISITADDSSPTHKEMDDPTFAFIQMMTSQVTSCFSIVQKDLISGFKKYSIHGLTHCVTRSLQDVSKVKRVLEPPALWSAQLCEIVRVNQEIINLALDILSGGKTLEKCPSFAEMGMALERLVSGSGDDEDEEEMLALSPEFQLLLSWCWINLKDSCSCLGEVVSISLSEGNFLLPISVLESVGEMFVKILTTCRHRGAIEGCRNGFSCFCSSLFSSKEPEVCDIPKTILDKILTSLSDQTLTASVTRRSAGLPIIVQTIVQAAKKTKNMSVLESTLDQLLCIASQPLSLDHSQQRDLSQSHALNILKVIFSDASLARALFPYLSRATVLVIQGFDSPSWAIRNAATQLISTLVMRIFGQRNKSDHQGSITLEEFESQYPSLLSFVSDSIAACEDVSVCVSSSLYVILTLLSGLGMSPSHLHTSRFRPMLKQNVMRFLCSPVLSLRKLSAQTLVALTPLDKTGEVLKSVMEKLSAGNMNQTHGWLQTCQSLLSTKTLGESILTDLIEFILADDMLQKHKGSCLLVASICLEILSMALESLVLEEAFTDKIWSYLKSMLCDLSSRSTLSGQINRQHSLKGCFSTMVTVVIKSNKSERRVCDELAVILTSSLLSSDPDMCVSALDIIGEANGLDLASQPGVQRALWQTLLRENRTASFQQIGEILLREAIRGNLAVQGSEMSDVDTETLKRRWKQRSGVQSVIFAVESMIWSALSESELVERLPSVCVWSEQLLELTNPSSNENLRVTAAQSLRLCGQRILTVCHGHQASAYSKTIVRCFLLSCLRLLEDSEPEVRWETAAFFSGFQDSQQVFQANLCYQIFSHVIEDDLAWCSAAMTCLVDILYRAQNLTHSVEAAKNPRSQALFEPETASSFSENHMTQLWAFTTLQSIITRSKSPAVVLLVLTACREACKELEEQMPRLCESLTGEPVMNVSCDAAVMSSLLGVKCLSLLQRALQNHEETKADLKLSMQNLISPLEQVIDFHPLLREGSALQSLLQPEVNLSSSSKRLT